MNQYAPNKRQREMEQARRQQEKLQRRMAKRHDRGGGDEVVSADDVQRGLPSIEEAMRRIEQGGAPGADRAASTIPARLFVGGLDFEVTDHDLRDLFGQFGPIADCIVMVDRATRQPRGFGFVTMANRKDAARVIEELHGYELKGRRLVVNIATDRR